VLLAASGAGIVAVYSAAQCQAGWEARRRDARRPAWHDRLWRRQQLGALHGFACRRLHPVMPWILLRRGGVPSLHSSPPAGHRSIQCARSPTDCSIKSSTRTARPPSDRNGHSGIMTRHSVKFGDKFGLPCCSRLCILRWPFHPVSHAKFDDLRSRDLLVCTC